MRAKRLTIQQRKEIFFALVLLQDQALMSNNEASQHIGKRFKIDDFQMQQIVDEGIDKDWLDEVMSTSS